MHEGMSVRDIIHLENPNRLTYVWTCSITDTCVQCLGLVAEGS